MIERNDKYSSPPTKATIKLGARCSKCGAFFINAHHRIYIACPECGAIVDIRERKKTKKQKINKKIYDKKWKKKNKEKIKLYMKTQHLKIKIGVFERIGNGKVCCNRCGCDDYRLLEVNHKNGGGCKECNTGAKWNTFMRAVYSGHRTTTDLELLCRPCNNIHYLERKYGKLPFKITWKNKKIRRNKL